MQNGNRRQYNHQLNKITNQMQRRNLITGFVIALLLCIAIGSLGMGVYYLLQPPTTPTTTYIYEEETNPSGWFIPARFNDRQVAEIGIVLTIFGILISILLAVLKKKPRNNRVKLTPTEAAQLKAAEESGYIADDEIDWSQIGQ